MPSAPPTLRRERAIVRRGAQLVAGIDEVGRGAIAGPVTVGLVVVSSATNTAPLGLRDSKLLSVARRESLAPLLKKWAHCWAVGHASAAEIDSWGINNCLRLAGLRALQECCDVSDVILDGSHDWLSASTRPELDLIGWPDVVVPRVRILVKADQSCSSVAAASVLAKVSRDQIMAEKHHSFPAYAWDANKGYGTPAHSSALRRHGLSEEHRQSWDLSANK